jgi:2,4-dienoyl-CoA reductase-like NADH-dependent reductase (Old Yellow Enzyme family)
MFSEERPRELSEEEIETIIENFVKAIARAKRAGFDGVQMHIAHGYLLAQFLSNHSNRRKDRWGGSLENRFRIVGEIFSRAKKEAGDFPLWAKINAYDGQKNGMRLDESVQIAKMLEDAGCGCIEVSCGVFEDGFFTTRGEKPPVDALLAYNFKFDAVPGALKPLLRPVIPRILPSMPRPVYNYNVDAAAAIKERVSVPVIAVGGIRSLEDMRSILDSGKADFVAMCRPLIMEPGLVNKFKEGAQERSRCIDCNFCAIAQEKNPLRCYRGKVR